VQRGKSYNAIKSRGEKEKAKEGNKTHHSREKDANGLGKKGSIKSRTDKGERLGKKGKTR